MWLVVTTARIIQPSLETDVERLRPEVLCRELLLDHSNNQYSKSKISNTLSRANLEPIDLGRSLGRICRKHPSRERPT